MKCLRCNGLMVHESALVAEEDTVAHYLRCLSCGEILDQLIMQNRANPIRDMTKAGYNGRGAGAIPLTMSGSGH